MGATDGVARIRQHRGGRRRRAWLAAGLGVALLTGVATPSAGTDTAPQPSVRPGSWIYEVPYPAGQRASNCTAGFVLEGNDGHRYLFVAGHCARVDDVSNPDEHLRFRDEQFYDDEPGDARLPTIAIHDGESRQRIGWTVYTLDGYRLQQQQRVSDPDHPRRQSPVGADIGLVRLDPGVGADPAMCFWGGPTGVFKEQADSPVTVRLFSNGATGQSRTGPLAETLERAGMPSRLYTVPAKTAVLAHARHPDFAHALIATGGGDSGSPVITADGQAVGVINGGAVMVQDGVVSAGPTYVVRIGPALDWMEKRLDLRLKLLRAPLREHPVGTTVGREECR